MTYAGLDKREVDGFMTYTRPEGKSGGHGVGWSEIPRYSFKVPPGWQESPVSIADLGGTEVLPITHSDSYLISASSTPAGMQAVCELPQLEGLSSLPCVAAQGRVCEVQQGMLLTSSA